MSILYECDRRACEKCRYPFCRYTKDISHAVNFHKSFFGSFVEKISIVPEQTETAQEDEEDEQHDNHN